MKAKVRCHKCGHYNCICCLKRNKMTNDNTGTEKPWTTVNNGDEITFLHNDRIVGEDDILDELNRLAAIDKAASEGGNDADVFAGVLKKLGFAGYKPSQMTNSDYWLCTQTAMIKYAAIATAAKEQSHKAEMKEFVEWTQPKFRYNPTLKEWQDTFTLKIYTTSELFDLFLKEKGAGNVG